MIRLYHEWNRETGAVTGAVRDDILEVARTMVGLEERFIDLAFALSEVEGMNANDIKKYVRFIADWRLTQLQLPSLFGFFDDERRQIRPHPLPWIVEILNGVEHANFFEQRTTEYFKGPTRGKWDGPDGVWEAFDRVDRPRKCHHAVLP